MLKQGKVVTQGTIAQVVDAYQEQDNILGNRSTARFAIDTDKDFQLIKADLMNDIMKPAEVFECEEEIFISLTCQTTRPVSGLYGYLTIKDQQGNLLIETDTYDHLPNVLENIPAGEMRFLLKISRRTLAPGSYVIYLNFSSKQSLGDFNIDLPGNILSFDVVDTFTARGNNRRAFLGTTLAWQLDTSTISLQKI